MRRQKMNACHMPRPVKRSEAKIYRSLRDHMVKAHCADKRPSHKCCGKITIDRTTMTLNCPLCGDARMIIGEAS